MTLFRWKINTLINSTATIVLTFLSSLTLFFLIWIIGYVFSKGLFYSQEFEDPYTDTLVESVKTESIHAVVLVDKKNKVQFISLEDVRKRFEKVRAPKWGEIGGDEISTKPAVFSQDPVFRDQLKTIFSETGKFSSNVAYFNQLEPFLSFCEENKGVLAIADPSLFNKDFLKKSSLRIIPVKLFRISSAMEHDLSEDPIPFRQLNEMVKSGVVIESNQLLDEQNKVLRNYRPILKEKIGFSLSPSFLFAPPAASGKRGGIGTIILNTLLLVLFSTLTAFPLSLGAAIYLTQYTKKGKLKRTFSSGIDILAGIPSIIFGLFGRAFFGDFLGMGLGFATAVLSISLMVMPTLIKTLEVSFNTVPKIIHDNGYALGADKLTVIFRLLLPASLSGIVTAILLSVGRVMSETAVLIFTLGSGYDLITSASSNGRVLSQHLYLMYNEAVSFPRTFASATVLILFILVINTTANAVLANHKRRLNG